MQEFLAQQLECPVCYEMARPPIHQCRNGHILCRSCYSALQMTAKCPTCREVYDVPIRNLKLEEMCCEATYKCRHEGCDHSTSYPDIDTHEATCPMLPRTECPVPNGCAWRGGVEEVYPHMLQSHSRHAKERCLIDSGPRTVSFTFVIEHAEKPLSYWIATYRWGSQRFLLIVRTTENELYALMAIYGTDRDVARNFKSRLSLSCGAHTFSYEGPVLTLEDIVDAKDRGVALAVRQSVLQASSPDRGTSSLSPHLSPPHFFFILTAVTVSVGGIITSTRA